MTTPILKLTRPTALLALAVLLLARRAYPEPQLLEAGRGGAKGKVLEGEGLPGAFWSCA